MPCFKCSNGKWRYGQHGKCQFISKKHCQKAETAINLKKKGLSRANKTRKD